METHYAYSGEDIIFTLIIYNYGNCELGSLLFDYSFDPD